MRIILLNPHEFDSPYSEEVAGVAFAPLNEHRSDDAFINEIMDSTQHFSFKTAMNEQGGIADQTRTIEHLLDCIGLATGLVLKRDAMTRAQIISSDWNDKSALIEIDGTRFWACWFTTA